MDGVNEKKSRLSYDPIFKIDGGDLKDMTALESNAAKVMKTLMYSMFAIYGFFLAVVAIVSDYIEINLGYVSIYMLDSGIKAIYFFMRLVSAVMVGIFIIYIIKADRRYEVTQWEGIGLLRSITFACVMISIVVVDFIVIFDGTGNDWVCRFFKGGTLIFVDTAVIDLVFTIPAAILSIAAFIVQLMKMGKQTGAELLYNSSGSDYDNVVFVDTNVKRMRCIDTDQGKICKVTSSFDSKEFK